MSLAPNYSLVSQPTPGTTSTNQYDSNIPFYFIFVSRFISTINLYKHSSHKHWGWRKYNIHMSVTCIFFTPVMSFSSCVPVWLTWSGTSRNLLFWTSSWRPLISSRPLAFVVLLDSPQYQCNLLRALVH